MLREHREESTQPIYRPFVSAVKKKELQLRIPRPRTINTASQSVRQSLRGRGTFKGSKAATESGGDNLVGLSRMTAAAKEGSKIPLSSKMVSCETILEISLGFQRAY